MIPVSAEEYFCKIILKNNLITKEALEQLVITAKSSGTSIVEEIRSHHAIDPVIIDKALQVVHNAGLTFATHTSHPHEPTVAKESSSPPIKSTTPEHIATSPDQGLRSSPKPLAKGVGDKLFHALEYAREHEASDLHIVPNSPPFIRRFGKIKNLNEVSLPPEQTEALLFSVLSSEQTEIIHRDLNLDFCLVGPDYARYRANIVRETNGWTGTFRIIQKHPPTFESLGLPKSVKRLTDYQQGLVLVTGPKGSGKTTTIAALLDRINRTRHDHVITVEDPIEYIHDSHLCQMTQRALGINTKSYANALRGALREDPDIIMVGELRDLDTISTSISASETGHLVLASLNTTSAIRTVDRVIDSFPAKQQSQIRVMIAESLRGIVCQQLLPRADGKGQVLALEVLLNNVSVRKSIIDCKSFLLDNVLQISSRDGMIRMDDSIQHLLDQKIITLETAKEFARDPSKIVGG